METSNEVWAQIPEHPGYEVSTRGRVRSYWKYGQRIEMGSISRTLRLHKHAATGYMTVRLGGHSGSDLCAVHRLVLLAFVGPEPVGCVCAHWDGDKTNNVLGNLRWATQKENSDDTLRHGRRPLGSQVVQAVLDEAQVLTIRNRYATRLEKQSDIAAAFGVDEATIGDIVRGDYWKHVGGPLTRRREAQHGTASRYNHYQCRCGLCVAANRDASRTRTKRYRERLKTATRATPIPAKPAKPTEAPGRP